MAKHPAKYSDAILPVLYRELTGCQLVLDPFAGTGKLKQVRPDAVCLEIEPEWATQAGGIQGNALHLPFADKTFDAICTSPAYGNRLSDHHNAKDGSVRHSYKFDIGHDLHPDNSGQMQWGDNYRMFHIKAWMECKRVLKRNSTFLLNISDHIRNRERMMVSDWHKRILAGALGFIWKDTIEIETPRLRRGANHDLRVDCEYVMVFRLV